LNRERTPREEQIQQHQINNQIEARKSKGDDYSTFADPDQAEEGNKEKEVETNETINNTPPEEQSTEEPAAATTQPNPHRHCP